eukprot:XP_011667708.1 PREDICTED: uncharacterized protein LOC105439882 [Strongylocentrotus purpuratus]
MFSILVKFLTVHLQGRDRLAFYNKIGEGSFSQSLLTVSRRIIPPPPHLISPGQQLLIKLSHNSHQTDEESFVLNATLVEDKASAMKIGPGETLNMTSPSYPENYPRCTFSFNTIEAPIGCRLKYHVLDHSIAPGDKLCISERKRAVNTEDCDVRIGAIRTLSRNFASLWFSSGLSSTWKGFFVSFTSVGETDNTPCIRPSRGLTPAPRDQDSNTASKPTRKKRANQNSDRGTSPNQTETATTAPPPWYTYPLLHLGGVLLAVVVIGVFLNQLIRHLMDLCCQRKDVTMATTSKIRTSRIPPQRNPSAVSETSRRDIKTPGTEGWTIAGTNRHAPDRGLVKQNGVPEATTNSDDPYQQSQEFISTRRGDGKPAPTLHRKSQSSLLEGDTYITGTFVSPVSPGLNAPNLTVFKQPPVSHVRLRDKTFNSKAALNKRASISMFDLTCNGLEDDVGLDTQLSLEYHRDGQNTSATVERRGYNPRTEASLTRCRENDQLLSSSTDSLSLTYADDRGQCYSPIEQDDRYSSAMAKFDVLCSSLQAEAEGLNPDLTAYANLPPVNRKRFVAARRPDRAKPKYLNVSKVVRAVSTSAHDLTVSSNCTDIDDGTKNHPVDNLGLSNTTSQAPPKSNLLSTFLRNPVSMKRSVTTSGDVQTTRDKDREVSAYRSYCEIDDIEPGCGMEYLGNPNDPQGYNLTNIRLDNKLE